jgi:hypothetical protein
MKAALLQFKADLPQRLGLPRRYMNLLQIRPIQGGNDFLTCPSLFFNSCSIFSTTSGMASVPKIGREGFPPNALL